MDMSWDDVAIDLSMMMVAEKDIVSSNALWGKYLELNGFRRGSLPDTCPSCFTIEDSYRRGRSPVTGRYISRGHEEGYSGHSIMDRMVDMLESMYDEAKTDHEKQTVSEWINRLRNSN